MNDEEFEDDSALTRLVGGPHDGETAVIPLVNVILIQGRDGALIMSSKYVPDRTHAADGARLFVYDEEASVAPVGVVLH